MRNYMWLLMGVILFTACDKDEEPIVQAKLDLVGEWTASEVSATATVNDVPYIQYVQEAFDLTEAQAEEYANEFLHELSSGLTGTISFSAENTYHAQFGNEPGEEGTWLMSNDAKTITLTESDGDVDGEAMELEVITLSATTLVVVLEEFEFEDMNDNGTDDELVISLELTFVK